MGNVGGDPAKMTGGARDLHTSGTAVHSMGPHTSSQANAAAGAAGDPVLSAAIKRFGAAWSHMLEDTGIQILAASQLAANAAQDLSTAAGGSGSSTPVPVPHGKVLPN